MKAATAIVMLALLTLPSACRTAMPEPVIVRVESRDSIRVEYRETVSMDTITTGMAVPAQSAMAIKADSSRLETDFAISYVWLTADGLLRHVLRNKATEWPMKVPVPVKTVSTDSIRERTIEVPVPYPVRVEVEREPSSWERIRLRGFLPAVAVALLCMGFIYKRIVRR